MLVLIWMENSLPVDAFHPVNDGEELEQLLENAYSIVRMNYDEELAEIVEIKLKEIAEEFQFITKNPSYDFEDGNSIHILNAGVLI